MLEKINLIIICSIIIIYSILIGTPLNNNIKIINFIIIAYVMIYILIKKIKIPKRCRIISSKIDILILLLCISTTIPILTNKNVTTIGSFEYLSRYITILLIYIIVKLQIKDSPKSVNYIIDSVIISGIIIFIFGIDNITYNKLENVLIKLNSTIVLNEDNRFISNFAYANTTALLMGIMFILSVFQYGKLKNNDIKKIIYVCSAFLAIVGVILSYSRAVWIIFGIFLIIYMVFYKEKEKILKINILSILAGILYSVIFIVLRQRLMYFQIYILLVVFFIMLILTMILTKKVKIKRIKKDYIIIAILLFLISSVIFYKIGKTQVEQLELFKSVYSENKYEQVIRNIKGEEIYEFSFNIEAKSKTTTESVYCISIVQRNKYDDEIETIKKEINSYSGIENITINTRSETTNVIIKFERLNRAAGEGLNIKDLRVNQQTIVLKYKYLPKSLVDKIESINLKQQSVWERFIFIEDGIKILKDNFLIGIGGDGYKYILPEYQQYTYGTNEVHCYWLEIWIEFGLIGIISFLLIIFFTIINFVNKIKTKENSNFYFTILTILCFILLHSTIDFDMSFMYIQIIFFIFLAMLDTENKKIKENKIIENISIILIIILVIFDLQYYVTKRFEKYNTEEERIISELQEEPYIERLNKIKKLLNMANNPEKIKFLIEESEKDLGIGKYEMYKRLNRAKIMKQLEEKAKTNKMQNDVEQIQEFLSKEFEKVKEIIYYKDKTRLTDEEIDSIINQWDYILK